MICSILECRISREDGSRWTQKDAEGCYRKRPPAAPLAIESAYVHIVDNGDLTIANTRRRHGKPDAETSATPSTLQERVVQYELAKTYTRFLHHSHDLRTERILAKLEN
jgi:hypothetical protein